MGTTHRVSMAIRDIALTQLGNGAVEAHDVQTEAGVASQAEAAAEVSVDEVGSTSS